MKFGVAMFFTDYSMSPQDLAIAAEERGFESVWAPEHSHIPVPRVTPWPGGGELPKQYYDVMEPVRVAHRRCGRDKDDQGCHRHLPGHPARPDPDRKGGREPRPGLAGPLPVRRRRRLERRGGREPRHRLQDPLQADARADRGDEGNLDATGGGVPRRPGRFRPDHAMAEAGAETASDRSSSGAASRMPPSARSPTATAGSRSAGAWISSGRSKNSARWRSPRGAIQPT